MSNVKYKKNMTFPVLTAKTPVHRLSHARPLEILALWIWGVSVYHVQCIFLRQQPIDFWGRWLFWLTRNYLLEYRMLSTKHPWFTT